MCHVQVSAILLSVCVVEPTKWIGYWNQNRKKKMIISMYRVKFQLDFLPVSWALSTDHFHNLQQIHTKAVFLVYKIQMAYLLERNRLIWIVQIIWKEFRLTPWFRQTNDISAKFCRFFNHFLNFGEYFCSLFRNHLMCWQYNWMLNGSYLRINRFQANFLNRFLFFLGFLGISKPWLFSAYMNPISLLQNGIFRCHSRGVFLRPNV